MAAYYTALLTMGFNSLAQGVTYISAACISYGIFKHDASDGISIKQAIHIIAPLIKLSKCRTTFTYFVQCTSVAALKYSAISTVLTVTISDNVKPIFSFNQLLNLIKPIMRYAYSV